MAVEAITWAYKQEVSPAGCKFVLVTLANYADGNGHSYPGKKKLGELTGQSESAVKQHIRTLEGLGLIRQEARYRDNGSRMSNGYMLIMDPAESNGTPPAESDPPPTPLGLNLTHPPAESDPLDTKEDTKPSTDIESVQYSNRDWPARQGTEKTNFKVLTPPNYAGERLQADHPQVHTLLARLHNSIPGSNGEKFRARAEMLLADIETHGEKPIRDMLELLLVDSYDMPFAKYRKEIGKLSKSTVKQGGGRFAVDDVVRYQGREHTVTGVGDVWVTLDYELDVSPDALELVRKAA